MCETNKYEGMELLLHYYKPGSLNIIGGRPGMGKTTFVVNLAVQYNKPVAFFSLEQSEFDLNKVEGFTNSKGLIFVDDPVQFTVGDFQQRLRQMKKEHDIQVAIVDYLQLMNVDLPNKSEINRNDELKIIASGLKAIAEELQIPIIVTSQISRLAEHRPSKKPILDDLCSSILDSVDDVHLLYRESYYGLNKDSEGKIELLSTEKNYCLGDILLLENNIDVLRRRLQAVEEELVREHLSTCSYSFDIETIEDEQTFRLICNADTSCVILLDSYDAKAYLKYLQPHCLKELFAFIGLYTPVLSDYIPELIARKQKPTSIKYDILEMEKYLGDTYGLVVYQEQIKLLSQELASFTRSESETLLKVLGRMQFTKMEEFKVKFLKQGQAIGHDTEILEKIWNYWANIAPFVFSKSHVTSLTLLAYQSSYLKAHYPECK